MAKSEKITAAMRLKSSMPTLAQPTAELWNTIFNVVLVLGAIAVLAGTWGAFWTGNMKEFYSNARISGNEAQTASANAAAEQAREGAAVANERAGKANEAAAELQARAGQLEKDAAEARAEQERLKVRSLELEAQLYRQGPRELTPGQKAAMSSSIRSEGYKPKVFFDWNSDPESHQYVNILGGVLQSAGLMVEGRNTLLGGSDPGIRIWDRSGVLQRAFSKAEIAYQDRTTADSDLIAVVQVGPKPMQ